VPTQPKFGGGATYSILHPVVLIAMIVAIGLIVVLPRRTIIVPILLSVFLVPLGQQFYVAGVHLFVLRLIVLAGLVRAMVSRDTSRKSALGGGWNSIDTAFSLSMGIQTIAVLILNPEWQAVVNQAGFVWDCFGGYFLLRSLILDESDIQRAVKCLAALAVVLGAAMVIEQFTHTNVFGLLGGVTDLTELRGGKIRSRAVFQHPLTAGAFGATLLPLLLLLWKNAGAKLFAACGIVGATLMTLLTNTSSALVTYAAGCAALTLWPLRRKMRRFRLGLLAVLVALQLAMKAPVWFLIGRIDLTGSSSSFHRAELVDLFIRRFWDWWLIGVKDTSTWGWDMWDVQNQYVSVGEAGGLGAFVFFILVIYRSFGRLGDARKCVDDKDRQWVLWFLGSALFAHLVSFLGVNYFDQSRIVWYTLLAMISAYTSSILQGPKALIAEPEEAAATSPWSALEFPAADSVTSDFFQ
jgi:hypothetical protein